MKHTYQFLRISCLALGSGLALSTTAQTLDPSFQRPQVVDTGRSGPIAGTIHAIVRQPDGKYVVGGSFSSINGV
ncbi:MAG TPA: delta-60 repeat domain-containing protein, partial [Hymenobacter sp.]